MVSPTALISPSSRKGNDSVADTAFSAAGQALGFGFGRAGVASAGPGNTGGLGDQLSQQVGEETDEEKRRKQLGLSITQSPAMQSLLGGVFR
jgi:hypothetical protein